MVALPKCEPLERREHLDAYVSEGVLWVFGTSGDDVIGVTQFPTALTPR